MDLTNSTRPRYNRNMEQLTTLQDVHNHITKHLLKQGVPSVNHLGTCLYRGPNNTSCAVGCLISDENYTEDLETLSIFGSEGVYKVQRAVKSSLNWEGDDTHLISLLADWQESHDSYEGLCETGAEKRVWDAYIREEADRIAEKHKLAS